MVSLAQIYNLYITVSEQVKKDYPQLNGWSFRWNDRLTNAMGRCVVKKKSNQKYIELSSRIVSLNVDIPDFLSKIRDTILHEWAHALEYEERGVLSHSPCWRKWMMKLGRPPERCYDGELFTMIPRGATHVIRNSATGRIFKYYNSAPTNASKESALKWHHQQLLRPIHEDLQIVNLETGFRTKVL
jgi:predicted SprT family Zn-dependent metalloprotease